MRNVLLLVSVAVLGGCSVGQNEFNCSRGDDNALCGSSRTIYSATNGDLKENETLTFIENGEKRQVTLTELEQIREQNSKPVGTESGDAQKGKISEKNSLQAHSSQVPHSFSYDGKVLRSDVKVLRVWIAPYVDNTDDLNLSTLVYTDIEKKRWDLNVTQGKAAKLEPKTPANLIVNNFAPKQESQKSQKEYRPLPQDVERIQTKMNEVKQ
ncbi:type IV conjugative transfer system lipoprotein TraV [Vibrio fluvialis]|jgi:conjugal transfer pilus assembly protein TraV|uniref:type IV conjugative transfer system lipoprotein TraV n=1 Tax=Vibrio fluvialis TaxID=676 RepID=UPI002573444D|nr:type IV conjugative transfer system lipoprotein TraV [Vibrio fluvialis]BEI26513.1 hypothetical protein KKIDH5335_48450 [Vibrio fluvialis]